MLLRNSLRSTKTLNFYIPSFGSKSYPALVSYAGTRNYTIMDKAKNALHNANLKAGKVAANGIDVVDELAHHSKDTIQHTSEAGKSMLHNANKKAGKMAAKGIDDAEEMFSNPEKKRVKENFKDKYTSLEDKGSKTESEQNRPEDGV